MRAGAACDPNCQNADLTDANLYGANLYGANLYGANLTGADLVNANLSGATLTNWNYENGALLLGHNLVRVNQIWKVPLGADPLLEQAINVIFWIRLGVIAADCDP